MTFLTPELLKGTDWFSLERAVARVLTHCGWFSVRWIGSSGDGGGDVIGVRQIKDRAAVFIVQVKAVSGDNYVGPVAIQEAVDAMSLYSGDIAVVATNGDFSYSAIKRRDELIKAGFDIRLWNGKFLQDMLEKWPEYGAAHGTLRPYQTKIVDKCLAAFQGGETKAHFIVATGLGKTVIATEILAKLSVKGLRRALILCHTQDLALQLEQSCWRQIGKSTPTRVFFDGDPPKSYEGINVGLYQTFSNYLSGIDEFAFDVVVVDEAHHAMSHDFRKCIAHLKPKALIGMTATPWRSDSANLNDLFGSCLGEVSLVEGMKLGYLAQVDYRIYCDTLDWKQLLSSKGSTLSIRELNKRLFVPQRDEAVISELLLQCKSIAQPRVIVFCASVEHGRRFAELLTTSSSIVCKAMSGMDKVERNKTLMEFAAGKIQAVTAVDLLNEGIDVPDVNVLIFLRTTHSRRIFVQQLGRGLRLSPKKSRVLVLDFVTDIRRMADVLEMDNESRERTAEYQNVFFENGIVTFSSQDSLPFVKQWINDVSDLGEASESHVLKFPEIV